MSRASISTGNITLDGNPNTCPSNIDRSGPDDDRPLHIALIGDFSGRNSRGDNHAASIASRKAIEIDRDNFEEVFSQLKVNLDLAVCDTPIHFREFDDLHPDYLVDHVPLFDQFRSLKQRLNKPAHFQQAADEIAQWQALATERESEQKHADEQEAPQGIPLPDNMLDAVLAQSASATATRRSANDIDQLIRSIVAPYVEAKLDPRLPDLLQAVDDATAHTLRKILHTPLYQALESNWRSVYLLVRRIETQRSLKVFLLDISPEELIDDAINHEQLEDSQLYQLLVTQAQVPGAVPFAIVQTQHTIEDDIDDLRLASHLAAIAQANQGICLAAGASTLAGCANIAHQPEPQAWQYTLDEDTASAWQTLRQSPAAEHLALTAPRFLLRLPYGKKSSPIEHFHFEELTEAQEHATLCWGNGAALVTLLLAQSYQQFGWQFRAGQHFAVEDLPLHLDYSQGGAEALACAEIYMHDGCANALAEHGLLSLRSVKGQAAVHVPRFRTVAVSGRDIFERN